MATSEDINTLFRRFGGTADAYQEIVATDQAKAAEQQWPMLGQLRPQERAQAPSAQRSVPAQTRAEQVEVVVYRQAAEPAVAAPVAPAPVAAVPSAAPALAPVPPAAAVSLPAAPRTRASVATGAKAPAAAKSVKKLGGKAASGSRARDTGKADLKAVFERMLPSATPAAPTPKTSKKAIKW